MAHHAKWEKKRMVHNATWERKEWLPKSPGKENEGSLRYLGKKRRFFSRQAFSPLLIRSRRPFESFSRSRRPGMLVAIITCNKCNRQDNHEERNTRDVKEKTEQVSTSERAIFKLTLENFKESESVFSPIELVRGYWI